MYVHEHVLLPGTCMYCGEIGMYLFESMRIDETTAMIPFQRFHCVIKKTLAVILLIYAFLIISFLSKRYRFVMPRE